MGTIIHKALVVVCDQTDVFELHAEAQFIMGQQNFLVSPIMNARTNGYCSFMIMPEGSKLGWATHEDADCKRQAYIKWLNEDAKCYSDHVYVEFGETEPAIIDAG